ncbi:MAG: hemolysin family protein [Melioribacteraceae bacterium]|nr:hemolysin family protein [Melioribacteraceae bacterium]WKZ70950.1 MAG: hemolysin family protein [Melioribacteraceae bacterium]
MELLILVLLLLLSAFFSSSEIAFVVANKIKIEIRARKKNISAINSRFFVKNPQVFFSTILISNNIVNIAFASLATVYLTREFGFNDFEILLVSTTLLLIIGEIIPKYIARESADLLFSIFSLPIRAITFLLYPFVKITSSVSSFLTRRGQLDEEEAHQLFDKDDFQSLINESSEAGVVNERESGIINKIIDLREQKVYECMTPRTDIVGVEISSSLEETLNILIESGYSKLPVYEENLDNIKGLIIAKDLFKNPQSIGSILRDVIFVPETKKTLEMLNELLSKSTSIAVVVDEFGGTAGIITVEDIIEEMLGEIRDEYDEEEVVSKKLNETTYVFSGKVEIDKINEEYDFQIPEGDYETIAGYIISELGRIPARGEVFTINKYYITILRSNKTKVDLIKLIVDPESLQDS